MPETKTTPVPTKTPAPTRQPEPEPVRRLNPAKICPDQVTRVTRTVFPLLP